MKNGESLYHHSNAKENKGQHTGNIDEQWLEHHSIFSFFFAFLIFIPNFVPDGYKHSYQQYLFIICNLHDGWYDVYVYDVNANASLRCCFNFPQTKKGVVYGKCINPNSRKG